MSRLHLIYSCAFAMLCLSCTPKEESGEKHYAPLKNPTKLSLEQEAFSAKVTVHWQDNCDNEAGYAVYLKAAGDSESSKIADLPVDSQEYVIEEGLKQGATYNIGVQAISAGPMLSSQVISKEIALFDYSLLPSAFFRDEPEYTPTSVCFAYNFKNSADYPRTDWGLCWSSEHSPSLEDASAHGPLASKVPIYQVLTAADLEYGKSYKVRAYVTCEKGTTYSEEVEVCLSEEPKEIVLNWTEISADYSLPEDVKLYKTTDKLNGRVFNAWYAIADVSKGNVEFRMEFSDKAKTLEDFYSEGNLIMTNAGYFNMSTGETGDFHAFEGTVFPSKAATTPRGTFGVDKDQKPQVCWAAKEASSGLVYFYDAPIASITGKNNYDPASENYPNPSHNWDPYYAMTAGPLLVKDGRIMIDLSSDGSTLVRNYENIAPDIFSASLSPDRTTVGYTEDGKIILFVCDGRITQSKGATILEAAQIMKGLGCVGAVNFDGGGSTAMTVNGKRINSLLSNTSGGTENRKVGSVMGFYKK